jgi:DNA-binding transcriptional ArsR family regulator
MVDDNTEARTLNHMVELQPSQLDAVFHALADPTRRAMLRRLSDAPKDAPLSIGELAAPHAMSLAAASKHIKALERAGMVRRQVKGRTHLCRLAARPLAEAHDWLGFYERFWTGQFDALDALLKADADALTEEDR